MDSYNSLKANQNKVASAALNPPARADASNKPTPDAPAVLRKIHRYSDTAKSGSTIKPIRTARITIAGGTRFLAD